MSKRVQYALSLPALPTTPSQEAGRSLLYAKADGMYYRLANGTEVGPLGVGGASGATVTDLVFPSTPSNFRLTVDSDGSLVTTATADTATLGASKGLVLAGSGGTNFRVTVDTDGALITTATTDAPGVG